MKRISGLIAATVTAALLVTTAACGSDDSAGSGGDGQPVRGGTLQYAMDVQPLAGGIDPMVANSIPAERIMAEVYETLLTTADDGAIKPGLASSYQQVGDTSYRLKLRKGVKFADGSAFDAEDVLYTFKSYQKSTLNKRAYLSEVKKITAPDDHTVVFKLARPDGAFLNALASETNFYVVSSDGYAKASKDQRERHSYGTGAFKLSEWKDGVSLTLARNPHYWDAPLPYLDKITYQVIPDDSTRLAAAQQGSVQAAGFLDGTVADQAKNAGWTMGRAYNTQVLPIYINPESGPLADVRVRRAISLAMDRGALVKTAMFGHGKVSYLVAADHPGAPQVSAETPYYRTDVAKAKQLLQQAGKPHPTIELSYFGDVAQAQHPIYELMQQQLEKAGITLKLKATSSSEMAPIFTSGETFTDLVSVPASYRPDTTLYFDQALSDAGAMNHWKKNRAADKARKLFADARKETDPKAKATKVKELSDEVADQVLVLVPMSVPPQVEVWDPRKLQGYATDPASSRIGLKKAWLTK